MSASSGGERCFVGRHVQGMLALLRQLRLQAEFAAHELPEQEGVLAPHLAGTRRRRFAVFVRLRNERDLHAYLSSPSRSNALPLSRGLCLEVVVEDPDPEPPEERLMLEEVTAPPAKKARTGSNGNRGGSGVCFNFQKGRCSRGSSCRFSHEAPPVQQQRQQPQRPAMTLVSCGVLQSSQTEASPSVEAERSALQGDRAGQAMTICIKHSGCLFTISPKLVCSTYATGDALSASGLALLQAHYERVYRGDTELSTQELGKLMAMLRAEGITLSFELVTASQGHEHIGQVPAVDYLVLAHARKAGQAGFMSHRELLALCAAHKLPANDTWFVRGAAAVSKIQALLEKITLSATPTREATAQLCSAVQHAGGLYVPGAYPHHLCQGSRQEGYVIYQGAELSNVELLKLQELSAALQASTVPVDSLADSQRRLPGTPSLGPQSALIPPPASRKLSSAVAQRIVEALGVGVRGDVLETLNVGDQRKEQADEECYILPFLMWSDTSVGHGMLASVIRDGLAALSQGRVAYTTHVAAMCERWRLGKVQRTRILGFAAAWADHVERHRLIYRLTRQNYLTHAEPFVEAVLQGAVRVGPRAPEAFCGYVWLLNPPQGAQELLESALDLRRQAPQVRSFDPAMALHGVSSVVHMDKPPPVLPRDTRALGRAVFLLAWPNANGSPVPALNSYVATLRNCVGDAMPKKLGESRAAYEQRLQNIMARRVLQLPLALASGGVHPDLAKHVVSALGSGVRDALGVGKKPDRAYGVLLAGMPGLGKSTLLESQGGLLSGSANVENLDWYLHTGDKLDRLFWDVMLDPGAHTFTGRTRIVFGDRNMVPAPATHYRDTARKMRKAGMYPCIVVPRSSGDATEDGTNHPLSLPLVALAMLRVMNRQVHEGTRQLKSSDDHICQVVAKFAGFYPSTTHAAFVRDAESNFLHVLQVSYVDEDRVKLDRELQSELRWGIVNSRDQGIPAGQWRMWEARVRPLLRAQEQQILGAGHEVAAIRKELLRELYRATTIAAVPRMNYISLSPLPGAVGHHWADALSPLLHVHRPNAQLPDQMHVTVWYNGRGAEAPLQEFYLSWASARTVLQLEVVSIDVSPEVTTAAVRIRSDDCAGADAAAAFFSTRYLHITLDTAPGIKPRAASKLPERLERGEAGVIRHLLPVPVHLQACVRLNVFDQEIERSRMNEQELAMLEEQEEQEEQEGTQEPVEEKQEEKQEEKGSQLSAPRRQQQCVLERSALGSHMAGFVILGALGLGDISQVPSVNDAVLQLRRGSLSPQYISAVLLCELARFGLEASYEARADTLTVRCAATGLTSTCSIGQGLHSHVVTLLVPLMALAPGLLAVRCNGPLWSETLTAMHIARAATGCRFMLCADDDTSVVVLCEGVGTSK